MTDSSEPFFPDPALRAAVLSEHAGATTALWALDEAGLQAWAREAPIADTPLTRLAWRRDSLLYRVVPTPVRDLAGLERLRELRVLDLPESELDILRPEMFAELYALEAVHLGVTPGTDLAALERCAALRRVVIRGVDEVGHASTLARLEARGVVVDRAGLPRPDPAPFADPNMKLAVLEALQQLGRVELPALIAIDEYELDEPHLQRLLALPLAPEQLAAVEELAWAGGGMALQHLVWPQFSGESDEFEIRSLDGLDALPNLRSLVLQWMAVEYPPEALRALSERGVEVRIE